MRASLVVVSLASSLASDAPADVLSKFQQFEAKWGKTFDESEKERRISIFADNLKVIEELQRQGGGTGTATYSYLGRWADRTLEEFASGHGLQSGMRCQFPQAPRALNASSQRPENFDWVAEGAVTSVRDQGDCASCWAHGSAAAVEGAAFLGSGQLVELSEQYLMDCNEERACSGCCGGLPERALQWLSKGHGMPRLQDYPYLAAEQTCRKDVPTVASIEDFRVVDYSSEDALKDALMQYGPIAIAMDTRWPGYQHYEGGIADPGNDCSDTVSNHVMTLVGFGVDAGVAYWKFKNSYSTAFGEDGYFRIVQGNVCGIGGCPVAALGGSLDAEIVA